MQKQFLANTTHELKTPLAVMKVGLDTLPSNVELGPAEVAELKGDLLEEVENLTSIVTDLLVLQAGESVEKTNLEQKVFVDFSTVCKKVASNLSAYAGQKHVTYKVAVEDGLQVRLHEQEVTRLVSNLVKNALDYTKADGRVEVGLSREGKEAVLTVSDTGIGISEEDQKYIFERFYKVKDGAINSKGSGLGLSIVKVLVEKVGGSIVVRSTVGCGTTVVVRVPLFLY